MMFQLDNTDYYTEATKTSLQSLTGKMAADVANAYQDRDPPKMLAWIHTHPNGGTTPSSKDRNGADTVRETFSRALGTNDFEFFNGIHAFDASWEQESTIEDQYNVTTDSNSASWIGTRFKHTLSMWDPTFTSPRQVEVVN